MVTMLVRVAGAVARAALVPAAFVFRARSLVLELVAVVLFTIAAALGSGVVAALCVLGVAALLKSWECELRQRAGGGDR